MVTRIKMVEKVTWENVNQTPIPLLSPAFKSNGHVFTSGCIGADPKTGIIISDIGKQTERAIKNLQIVLEKSGTSLEKVLKVTLFITDEESSPIVNEVYGKYFLHQPARSCIIVKFANHDIKVEIECVAEYETV